MIRVDLGTRTRDAPAAIQSFDGLRTLRELGRSYRTISQDLNRMVDFHCAEYSDGKTFADQELRKRIIEWDQEDSSRN